MVTNKINKFRKDLRDNQFSDLQIVRKYLCHGAPYIFEAHDELYLDLKDKVADFFKVSTLNVVIIGSSKLGFSIKPDQLWKHIHQESDIDIAIINEEVFDLYWKDLFELNVKIMARTEEEDRKHQSFKDYLFKGWLRPDLFPFEYSKKREWSVFTRSLYNVYDKRKISIGIFKSEYFFESYHKHNINNIRRNI